MDNPSELIYIGYIPNIPYHTFLDGLRLPWCMV